VKNYQLKQPEKNPQPVVYWLFVVGITLLLIWITIINPVASGNFDKSDTISSLEYILLTSGAFVIAGLSMIPVIRNDRAHDYALALIMANSRYMMHIETMKLMDDLTYHVWRKGNAAEIVQRAQDTVNAHEGKDMWVVEYNMKSEFAENLPLES
jgi:hypothetical protein